MAKTGAGRAWVPSEMEKTCLRQLDHDEAWRWLKHERPAMDVQIPWAPLGRIFGFNLTLFVPIFGVLTVLGWQASGEAFDAAGFATVGAATLVLGAGMAAYATSIYRRAWNRRARSYEEVP